MINSGQELVWPGVRAGNILIGIPPPRCQPSGAPQRLGQKQEGGENKLKLSLLVCSRVFRLTKHKSRPENQGQAEEKIW